MLNKVHKETNSIKDAVEQSRAEENSVASAVIESLDTLESKVENLHLAVTNQTVTGESSQTRLEKVLSKNSAQMKDLQTSVESFALLHKKATEDDKSLAINDVNAWAELEANFRKW